MLPSIFDLQQHFRNIRVQNFNDDFDTSHYLYNDKQL